MSAWRELFDLFDSPPRDFSPTPLWWWSGGTVTRERIRWQMERFARGGVFNLVVINLAPAGPLAGAQADDPAWFSPTWWDRFADACEIATELGMRMWFYDQIGFSGANIQGSITGVHPQAKGRALGTRWLEPGQGVALGRGEELLAVYDEAGARVAVDPSGAPLTASGRVRLVVTVPTAFDYLDPQACALLVDTVHGEFDRRMPGLLGNVIAGSFQDELPAMNTWTPAFAERFSAEKGYDLLEHLPALWERGGAEAAKVRGDYVAVRSLMAEEAFFRPLAAWHDERGMLLGCDQFNPARAGFPTQATQLYADYFRTHRWYSAAGSDHEGDAKVHSSMAHLYGHDRVWLESFHSSGWGGTLEDTYDWLVPFLRSGANLYNPHASYFDTVGGWFEWAPPSTDWRQPYWSAYPDFARAVARIGSMMTWGTYSADVAVLHPTATAQALITLDLEVDHFGDGKLGEGYEAVDDAQETYLDLVGTNNWFATRLGVLDDAGVAFDVIDDSSVQAAGLDGGVLTVRDLRYRAVVVPAATVLEQGTAQRLLDLLDAGGRVLVVGRLPELAAGRAGDDAVVRRLATDPRVERAADAQQAAALLVPLAGHVTSDVPLLVRRDGTLGAAMVPGAFPNASAHPLQTDTWLWKDFDFDPARYAQGRELTVRATVAEAQVWNPATGVRLPAAVRTQDGVSVIDVPLDGAPAAIVVWREGEPASGGGELPADGGVTVGAAVRTGVELADGWSGALVPTMDNTWGDLARPLGTDVAELQIWNVDWAQGAGSAEWAGVRATYGERVRVLAPCPPELCPAPLTPSQVATVLRGEAPLAAPQWSTEVYSASRGPLKHGAHHLGPKGEVPEEFVRVLVVPPGEESVVRAIVHTDATGSADLVVAGGCAKRVWWNGVQLAAPDGYLFVARVELDGTPAVLEYRLGQTENAPGMAFSDAPPYTGTSFALTPPDAMADDPQFMTAPEGLVPAGRVRYTATLDVPTAPGTARLVVGAATGLTVLVDGTPVARQEKVEYYVSAWGATPMFFAHDVTAVMVAGTRSVEIVTDSRDVRDVLFVDLVVQHVDGVAVLSSGLGWRVQAGEASGSSQQHRGHWSELAYARAAARPHPLRAADWLAGPPLVGEAALALSATDDAVATPQHFRLTLPSGAVAVDLPLAVEAWASVGGAPEVPVRDGVLELEPPTEAPTELTLRTAPTVTARGGSAWTGPLRVRTTCAPIELGDWQRIGLRAWSGGVTYRRTVEVPTGATAPVLDLGRVRGAVTVQVDGVEVGRVFCAPFRVALGALSGSAEVAVTVTNTLAPYLDESGPTTWVFPSQLVSGLLGPVTLTWGTAPAIEGEPRR